MNDFKCHVEIVFGYNAIPGGKPRMEVYVEKDMEEFDWSLATTEGLRRLMLEHAADAMFFAAMIDTPAGRQVGGICMGKVEEGVTPQAAEKFVREFYRDTCNDTL